MISKKAAKERNQKKVNSVNVEKNKQLITRRGRLPITQSSISGEKQRKIDTKSVGSIGSKQNKSNNQRIKDKKAEKSSPNIRTNVKNWRTSERKTENSFNRNNKNKKTNNNNNKSNKTKIKRIKEIAKRVKTKTNKKLKKVVKRNLRNNSKTKLEKEDLKMKNINNINNNLNKNKNSKQISDTIALNIKDNEKLSQKNICQNSTNLCSKLFPTLNCVKSLNSSKCFNKSEKQQNSEPKSKTNFKIKSKKCKKEEQKQSEKSSKSKKIIQKTKTNKIRKSVPKSKHNSSSKQTEKKVKNQKQKVKQNNNKSKKSNNKTNSKKSSNKEEQKKWSKKAPTVRRGHRLASLNAIAKVRLLCENESEKNDIIDESSDESNDRQRYKNNKNERKISTKGKANQTKNDKECKALVAVDKSQKQLAIRKRKRIDDNIEIIDTRQCKRMASLNASAIMAASYSPERVKRSKSVESNSSIEMIGQMETISETVSRFEMNPTMNGINGLHVNRVSQAKSVILKAQKHESIESVKQLKVSNKIKDRLLGIARLERDQKAQQKRKAVHNRNTSTRNHCIGKDNKSLVSGGELSGFQATKVQVTKVTHINTSQDKKCGHKIDSILERDSAVVHKYQVQTKSTIEMQTTFNSSNGSTIANVTTITAPQQTPTTGSGPRMQVHISGAPAHVVPAPILSSSNSGQPTYYNFPGAAPIVQVHNNQYQTMTSSPHPLNPMSIINLSEPYPTHYSSAFSVPHFATHSHPTQNPFNYFHPGLYQPAGPLLQPFHDPCLIHKPIPFHPPSPQVTHLHNSSQFSDPNLQTHSTQTFQNEMTQQFPQSTQFFHQLQTPMRPSQAVFFQALPQTSGTLGPNATTYTLVNPGVHYSQPTIINSEQQFPTNENQILNNEMTFLNKNIKLNTGNDTNPSVAQPLSDSSRLHISKSIQCSPQSKDDFQTISENQFCDSTNSSVRMSQNTDKTPVITVGLQTPKKANKSDHKSDRRKKSLLLKPSANRKGDEVVVVHNNNSQTLLSGNESEVSALKSLKNALTPSNLNKTNSINKPVSQQKSTKTVCVSVNTSLPSVSLPSMPSLSPRLLPSRKQNKKRCSHGWQWEGMPVDKYVYLNNEEQSYLRKCYPAIRHNEGDLIRVRDCVLLRSGPRRTDLPFVAKIAALWETPEGEMMMSLLWYYRPEHTDLEYYSNEMVGEIFASKHRDTNSVACIDDKCYVLTYNEFCRYKRSKVVKQSPLSASLTSPFSTVVPVLEESYPRANRLPPTRVFPELVFCCRKVYDYRQKRILKNPI